MPRALAESPQSTLEAPQSVEQRASASSAPETLHGIAEPLTALAVPVTNLIEAPTNPRRGDVEAIARSYRVFGQRKPIVVRRTGSDEHGQPVGIVEAGNHSLRAARDELGWTHLAVVWVDDDETTAAAYGLADNRTADLGSYDNELLAAELARVAAHADDELLAATAYSADDLARLLGTEVSDEPIGYDVFDSETVVASAFAHYREHGLPMVSLSVHESMQEINRLAATDARSVEETTVGYSVADTYHPHRFQAKIPGKNTVWETFERDDYLMVALRLLAATPGQRIDDTSILNVLPYTRGAQAASNFRPGFALSIYRRYGFEGATVLDTSTGYGGRLVGFLASRCARYVGVDPNAETHAANVRLAADLAAGKVVELINLPAEDVTDEIEPESCDVSFTSPPYFAKEHYSDDPTQSWVRYPSGDAWRDGFLRPTIELTYRSLRPDSVAVINIADVKIGATSYPLVTWAEEAARAAGFRLLRRDRFPLGGRVRGRGERRVAWEPLLVFVKE